MSKGDRTRTTILEHATGLASQLGLTGLTIGVLADELRLSKSGLFAHFRSKEALQIQVLDHAAAKRKCHRQRRRRTPDERESRIGDGRRGGNRRGAALSRRWAPRLQQAGKL